MIKHFNQISIKVEASILDALKQMDRISRKLLLVIDNKNFVGILSIGDIHRAIIKNHNLETPVKDILQTEGRVVARVNDPIEQTKKIMLYHRTEFMPVLDENDTLVDIYFWEDLFVDEALDEAPQFDLPVVVMAGGFGKRLRPLTNIIPKPLIPLTDKSILEEIFDRFVKHGSKRFYLSVNYKADLIRFFIESLRLEYDISFIEEDQPFGTAGSLSLLKGKINETFFVTNCDILINQDYSEILDFHKENQNEITIVSAVKNLPISYGLLETGDNGHLDKLVEKQDITIKINSGMYILEPHLIDEIPVDTHYNLTDLILDVKNKSRKIGVFPVWHSSWIDIGDWSEYLLNLKRINNS